MNKKVLFAIILGVVVLVASIICLFVLKNNNPVNVELIYKSNGGVPYKWEYTIEDPSIVKLEDSYVVEDKNEDGMVGAPIKTKYIFKGLKEGVTTVTFKYVSIVDGSIEKEEVNTLKVDKNNNTSLVLESNK